MKSHIPLKESNHFLIAAPKSNSGKTLISLGLMRAFRDKGKEVNPFKCGPDFIDPIWHKAASGNTSLNIDLFMMSPSHINDLYNTKTKEGSINISEGVMGLFDGAVKDKGSTAEIAELLQIPIILVVDGSAMAYSAAPLLYGYKHFSKKINIVGVIFNKVNSLNHYHLLKEACLDVDLEPLGYLPKITSLEIPSRHLGLDSLIEEKYEKIIEEASLQISKHVDLNKILKISTKIIEQKTKPERKHITPHKNLKIAIAKDSAFTFTYKKNVDLLKSMGEVIFFSPLNDSEIPDCDFAYIPGGYPELFLEELNKNLSMRNSIKNYCNNDGALYAECGGMMYLGDSIRYRDKEFEMLNVLSLKTEFEKKFTLGYRILETLDWIVKGHEFHYSSICSTNDKIILSKVLSARNEPIKTPVFRHKNTIASYLHLYWGDNQQFLGNLFKSLLSKEISTPIASNSLKQ